MTPLKSNWESWREQLWATYVRLESTSDSDDFYGEVDWAAPDCNRLSTVRSMSQLTERTPSHLRSDPRELVLVAIQKAGAGFIEQDGRRARLDVGDFGLYDTTRPYRLYFDGPFEELVFLLPLEDLSRRLPGFSKLTGRRFAGSGGAGAVATGFIERLAASAPSLGSSGVANFDAAAIELLATAIELQSGESDSQDEERWNRVVARVFPRLRDPEIDWREIALQEGLSLRGLQRLFQAQGTTPTLWLQERRLEGVARDMRTGKCSSRSITAIAFSWGFNDLSHFNRVFRAKFGRPPRDLRGA